MRDIERINQIFSENNGMMRTGQLTKAKIFYADIAYLLEKGYIEKVRTGYYQWLDSQNFSEVITVAQLFPDGIFCMDTALRHYGYSDRTPAKWHIAVSKHSNKTRFKIDYPFVKPYYTGLLELGALDDYDLIKDGCLKYIVLTEDSSMDGRNYLNKVLEASGFSSAEYKIFSYNSISRIDSAKIFAKILLDLNPSLHIIIYRDRDGLYDDEIIAEKAKIEFDPRVKCVIAQKNDIEMYFCDAHHITSIVPTISDEDIAALISEAINECEEESKRKFYTHRTDIARQNRTDTGAAIVRAEQEFALCREKFIYGKKLSGLIAAKLQQKLGQNINIFVVSPNVSDPVLLTIHSAA